MAKIYPLINILTSRLPRDLAVPMYKEYENRLKEANFIIELSKKYEPLQAHKSVVEILLAISIFYKRVIANLDGAVKFYGTVHRLSEATIITIGTYQFSGEEKNKVLALLISYRELLKKYEINEVFMEYAETKDFLKNVLNLKRFWDNAEA